MNRESMTFDVLIVGGGAAGLAAAIRLKQINADLSVCLIDKGSEIGAHILSGAVMDPRALNELIPDWQAKEAPLDTLVAEDRFLLLSESGARSVPNALLPGCFLNHGNYIISLGLLCRWLGAQAEALGVEIYPGFAAAEVIYDSEDRVLGVITGDMGVGRDGTPTDAYHPSFRTMLNGGKRLAYGARAIAAGGLQALPKLTFPGGALVGDDAGFLVASRIKGSHAALKTGMLAAEAAATALAEGRAQDELTAYPEAFRASWLYDELHRARNFKPWMSKGLYLGSLMFGIDQQIFRGKAPWTLHHTADHEKLLPANQCEPIAYPKPDGVLSFDRLSSVLLSNTNHEEEQPCHLKLKDSGIPIRTNLATYDAPERRYCPAGVYEIVCDPDGTNPRLQINAQNCVHCKTCDIKDPTQNITWLTPQGGEGPIYQMM